jgi:hypothetical protein
MKLAAFIIGALLLTAIWYGALTMGIIDGGVFCRKRSLGYGECWQVWVGGEKYSYSGAGCYQSSAGKTICYD